MKKLILLVLIMIGCNVNPPDIDIPTVDVSEYISEQDAVPDVIPDAPQNITAISGDNSIIIEWDSVSGADEYTIYCDQVSGGTNITIQNATSPYDYTVANGLKRYCSVTASNGNGESDKSAEVSATAGIVDNLDGTVTIVTENLTFSKCSQKDVAGNDTYNSTNNDCSNGTPARMEYCDANYECDDSIILTGSGLNGIGSSQIHDSCTSRGAGWHVSTYAELQVLHSYYDAEIFPDIVNDKYWMADAYAAGYGSYIIANPTSTTWSTSPPPGNSQQYLGYVICVK